MTSEISDKLVQLVGLPKLRELENCLKTVSECLAQQNPSHDLTVNSYKMAIEGLLTKTSDCVSTASGSNQKRKLENGANRYEAGPSFAGIPSPDQSPIFKRRSLLPTPPGSSFHRNLARKSGGKASRPFSESPSCQSTPSQPRIPLLPNPPNLSVPPPCSSFAISPPTQDVLAVPALLGTAFTINSWNMQPVEWEKSQQLMNPWMKGINV
jgi:hypothetical protein